MFIPSVKPVQLVKNFDEVPAAKRVYPMVAQEKHDGCYAFAYVNTFSNDCRIFSRTGKSEFVSLSHLTEAIRAKFFGKANWHTFVLIFEVMAEGMSAAAIAGRCQDLSDPFPEAYAVVHDLVECCDFEEGYCPIAYKFRHTFAKSTAETLGWKCEGYTLVHDDAEAHAFADKLIAQKKEGAVFKNPQGDWKAGRKDFNAMKLKEGISFDLEVIGVERGKGKYKDTLGTLVCKFRAFGEPEGDYTTVSVSGMSDAQRTLWWSTPSHIIGEIVQVDAMKFTDFGNLREPRFKGIRIDKESPDII